VLTTYQADFTAVYASQSLRSFIRMNYII